MKVKRCFGRYGDIDLEKVFIDNSGKEVRILNCTMMCRDFCECRDCYYLWWKHRRPYEEEIRKVINKFMQKNKLRF
jgi:hypothetical protein